MGGVLLGGPNEHSYSRSSISLSMVTERKSRFGGNVSAFYVVLDDAIADMLSSI
jgi:hypothetical protein